MKCYCDDLMLGVWWLEGFSIEVSGMAVCCRIPYCDDLMLGCLFHDGIAMNAAPLDSSCRICKWVDLLCLDMLIMELLGESYAMYNLLMEYEIGIAAGLNWDFRLMVEIWIENMVFWSWLYMVILIEDVLVWNVNLSLLIQMCYHENMWCCKYWMP